VTALPAAPVFLAPAEAAMLAAAIDQDSLIGRTLRTERATLDRFLAEPIVVPGSGPGGGVAHEQHKRNYQMLFAAGRFWQMTGEPRYAQRVRALLLGYAEIFEHLPYAQPFSPNPPGRLFHQILNEQMWLLFASAGYSSVRAWLPQAEREQIETHLFAPMVAMFAHTYSSHFDIIHNHGMWASSAVGIAGIATGRVDWLDLALYGQFGDGRRAGFLAQLALLFSPSGYYEEGPYYQRFAIQPMLLFAEALQRARPDLNIYEYHDHVVRRGFYAALHPALPDGALLPLNDALKRMNIDSLGYVLGASLMFRREAPDPRLLWLAQRNGQVWPDAAGLALSDALAAQGDTPPRYHFPSVELTSGTQGDRGAVGLLRADEAHGTQALASLDYGTHGLAEHAHFDGLTLSYFARGHEVLRDYGSVRWINIEPKQGGSYLPENLSFAKQTIAHNTVTIDGISQHSGDAERASGLHGSRVQFSADDGDRQMMTGEIRDFTPGVAMRRAVALVRHADFDHPLLIDVVRLQADAAHRYDLAYYYDGQIIRLLAPYTPADTLSPLGTAPGYRHLWRLGSGNAEDGHGLLSWLQDGGYHSLIFASDGPTELILTRIGANDPNFNLRAEPGLVLRRHSHDAVFATVLECHGVFDEATELSRNARGRIERVQILHTSATHTVLRLSGPSGAWLAGLAHTEAAEGAHHVATADIALSWQGAVVLLRDDRPSL
jgi:oligo-alginate lyase